VLAFTGRKGTHEEFEPLDDPAFDTAA